MMMIFQLQCYISKQTAKQHINVLPFNHVWALLFYGQLWINLYRVVFVLQTSGSGLEVTGQNSCLLQGTWQIINKQYYSRSSLFIFDNISTYRYA